jgi:hypothetical protein
VDGEHLIYHGCAGHLGRFRPIEVGAAFGRGAPVVVRSRRGLELGEVLCQATADGAWLPDPEVGELVRAATADDVAAAGRNRDLSQRLFDDGSRLADARGLPLAFLDVEVLLDRRQALLHAIRLGPCDEGSLLEELGDRYGLIVRLYDLAGEPAENEEQGCGSCGDGGCGEGGCGEGGCGSSGDGCGSCSAGGSQELATYFADLREKMEQGSRVPLL